MSNHHYIKGLRRKASRRGLGRGQGNVAALVEETERRWKADEADKQAGRARVRAAKQDALAREVEQDKKRARKVSKKGMRT